MLLCFASIEILAMSLSALLRLNWNFSDIYVVVPMLVEKWGAHDCYCFLSSLTWMVANGNKRIAWLHGFPHLFAVFFMHWFRTGILNVHPVFDGE
jgi:hypothetical protein